MPNAVGNFILDRRVSSSKTFYLKILTKARNDVAPKENYKASQNQQKLNRACQISDSDALEGLQ